MYVQSVNLELHNESLHSSEARLAERRSIFSGNKLKICVHTSAPLCKAYIAQTAVGFTYVGVTHHKRWTEDTTKLTPLQSVVCDIAQGGQE
jgi:hypothetical protein